MANDNEHSYQNGADESLLPPKVFANSSYSETKQLKVYKKRWYILLVYCVNVILQNVMWNTWGPIEATARAVYKWDSYVIDLLAAWGSMMYCVTMVPFAWVMDVKGLRVTMLLSAGMAVVGSVLRSIPVGNTQVSTILIHCGQIIIDLMGPVCMAAPPLLSSTWFPPHQRTTATAIMTVAYYVGTAGSFLIGPAFVDDVKTTDIPKVGDNYRLNTTEEDKYQTQISSLLYFEAALQVAVFILIAVYYPSRPPIPPSASAGTGRIDFKSGAKALLKNYNFLLLSIIYGASTGVYGGWCSVLYQNLSDYGISVDEKFAAWLGFVAVISGSISGVLFSSLADHFSRHMKSFLIVFMALSFFTTLSICYIFTGVFAFNEILVYVVFGLSGFFLIGTVPFFFELGVEIAYPVAEGITSGVTTFFNNFLQTIFLAVPLGNLGTKWMLWTTVITCAVSTVLLLFVKEEYNRSSVDQRARRGSDYTPDTVNS
ncbi:solute carrier family 49 member 4 homolog isoform X2 [Dendronephthya gigantea]|nr:solute carrier family 49 member 4 homolog isoform X2 [Dendronephthya gigantea]XP_028404835.1 solute carrier family 49 member 4 homolog isoform X2 [Dendronephthya gigantea]